MSRFRASLGATLTAVAVAAIPSVLLSAPADAAAPVVVRVGPADLGPNGPWLRLQDDPGNAGRPPGVQEVSPFADPVRFDGSLHLAVAAAAEAQQAQAAHYFTSTVPLSTVAASPLSYDLYVKGSTSTPAAIPYGANLRCPRSARASSPPSASSRSWPPTVRGVPARWPTPGGTSTPHGLGPVAHLPRGGPVRRAERPPAERLRQHVRRRG